MHVASQTATTSTNYFFALHPSTRQLLLHKSMVEERRLIARCLVMLAIGHHEGSGGKSACRSHSEGSTRIISNYET